MRLAGDWNKFERGFGPMFKVFGMKYKKFIYFD